MHNDQIDAEVKALCGMYQKMLLVPRPDYGSRLSELTLFLHHSLSPQEALSSAVEGNDPPSMADKSQTLLTSALLPRFQMATLQSDLDRAITQVLTERRIQQVHTQ